MVIMYITTVSPDDYEGVSGQIIQFNTGHINATYIISITQDEECEDNTNEYFSSNIVLDSGVQPIEVIHPQANITVVDTLEPECGKDRQLFIVTILKLLLAYITPEGMVMLSYICATKVQTLGTPCDFATITHYIQQHPYTGTRIGKYKSFKDACHLHVTFRTGSIQEAKKRRSFRER